MGKKNREHDTRLANSFSTAEVEALLLLHHTLLRGGDAARQLTSPPVLGVVRKFQAMHAKSVEAEYVARARVAQAAPVGRSS